MLFIRPNGLSQTRLGITTPTHLGKAVLRNRLKRRLREIFRLNRSDIPGGWDIVLNPRGGAARVSFNELRQEILQIFPRRAAPSGPEVER